MLDEAAPDLLDFRAIRADEEVTGVSAKEQFPVEKTDEEWRAGLTSEQYRVLRRHGTERAGTSALNDEHRVGVFRCAGCGQPLYESQAKFESGRAVFRLTLSLAALDYPFTRTRLPLLRRDGGRSGKIAEPFLQADA